MHICGVVSLWKSSGIYECSIILSFWCVNWNIPQEVVHSNPPLIGWAHTQNDHCNCCSQSVHDSALIPPWSSLSLIEATTCGLSATKQTVKPLSKFAQTQIRYLLPLLQATFAVVYISRTCSPTVPSIWSPTTMRTHLCSCISLTRHRIRHCRSANVGHALDDVIICKRCPRYWSFVRGIHWSPMYSTHKGQWREALMFFICTRTNSWANNRNAIALIMT